MRSLILCLLFVGASHGFFWGRPEKAAWTKLYVTFGKFNSLPKTAQDARDNGWTLKDLCSDKNYFAGHRYVLNGDTAVMLLFGSNGQVAGIQMGVKKCGVGAKQAPWVKEGKMYVLTAYFRDPGTICNRTETSDSYGDRLVILNGAKGSLIEIPFKEEDLVGTNWVKGKCFVGMGQHYWYNISSNMNCGDFYPVFLLYNDKRLDGFGWNTMGNLTSKRYEHPTPDKLGWFFRKETQPKCLDTAGPLTTQHVYMRRPYTIHCLWR